MRRRKNSFCPKKKGSMKHSRIRLARPSATIVAYRLGTPAESRLSATNKIMRKKEKSLLLWEKPGSKKKAKKI